MGATALRAPTMDVRPPILEMRGISKTFPAPRRCATSVWTRGRVKSWR